MFVCVCVFCLFICCIQLLKLSSCFSLVIKNFKTSEMRLHEENHYAFFSLRQSALSFIIRRAHSRIIMIISLLDQHRICVLSMYLLKSVQDAAVDASSFLMENKLNQNGKIERALCTILSGILECNTWKCGCVMMCCAVETVHSARSNNNNNNNTCLPILFAELLSVVWFYRTIKTEVAISLQSPE